jgi:hypothetical protein
LAEFSLLPSYTLKRPSRNILMQRKHKCTDMFAEPAISRMVIFQSSHPLSPLHSKALKHQYILKSISLYLIFPAQKNR